MPKKSLIRSRVHPYHITARGNNKEPFHCTLIQTWLIMSFYLQECRVMFGVRVHAFVLMPNHFHLLMSTPNDDLGVVMKWFMASVTRTMNRFSGRSGRVFGARYHWSLVSTDGYFDHVLKYIYRNPVKGRIVESVEEYSFSTINFELGRSSLPFPTSPPLGYGSLISQSGENQFLTWLNEPFQKEIDEEITLRLRKRKEIV